MNLILSTLLKDNSVKEVIDGFSLKRETVVYGLSDSQKYTVTAAAFTAKSKPLVIVTANQENVNAWREDLSELLPSMQILEMPELDLMDVQAEVKSIERSARRMEILEKLIQGENLILLSTITAAIKPGMSKRDFQGLQFKLSVGGKLTHKELFGKLSDFGYERTNEVESIGQFSVRGGIVDIFAVNSRQPYRIEFFGDEIDSIREYNVNTKRSIKNVDSAAIMPIIIPSGKSKKESFLSYVDDSVIIFDEPARLNETIKNLTNENPEIKQRIFNLENLLDSARSQSGESVKIRNSIIYTSLMPKKIRGANVNSTIGITAAEITSFQGHIEFFIEELNRWIERRQRIIILLRDVQKIDRMKETLNDNKIQCSNSPDNSLVILQIGSMNKGFELPSAKLVIITEKELFGHQARRPIKSARRSDKGEVIKHFRDINPGDYVVHSVHGIGKYVGVETIEVEGVHRDYLHIQYRGEDKIFVPTDQVQSLQKYIANDEAAPRLSKLNSNEWARTKSRTKAEVEDIAKKLIDIYARRQNARGFSFSQDDVSQRDFEATFPYEETEDQLQAIAEVKADMESDKPMERLICGDVGFGKTEIAIRAAYKAAMNGKQTAVLVPTTVLAQQHYQTFSERFAGFLPTVDVICRFRTPKEQRETLAKVKAGQVDILIGTHAILNTDKVKFHDLGLLVIDEEQRFGVKQKEKIRDLSVGVDVLSLSATPIPRTLHMSLTGARDMSIIETAPAERLPVQTYVVESDDEIIRDAINRELNRGGQVFFIYNRIETIGKMRTYLEELVPQAKIQTAHGRMSDDYLEQVMMDFYEGAFDILLTTSIVENGLNVANANTIIVYNADNFGLSQLYQMRGRVGRSHRMAFAYFVYKANKMLTEEAEKRLQAMKEFAQLGAGFKIAMRDLQIRGAGNLLGAQQHGHIASVGFEMYCQLLEEAVSELKHETPIKKEPDPVISLKAEAYIDNNYIEDAMHKLEIYQRIAVIDSDREFDDLIDELIDRFGEPTPPVNNLLIIAQIKYRAKMVGIKSIQQDKDGWIDFLINENVKVNPKGIVKMINRFKDGIKLLMEQNVIKINITPKIRKNILTTVNDALKMFL